MIKKLRILGLFFSLAFLFSFQNCAPFESSFQGLSSVGFFQGYEPKVSNNPFTCNPGVEPEAHALRRLTKKEYENSIRDLFRGALSESDIQSAIRQIPTEETSVDFKNFNSSPGLSHIEGYFSAAEDIAEKVTTSDSVLAQFMGSNCVTLSSALSAQCLSQITETFFKRAFRRPLSQAELDKLVAIYNEADNHLLGIQSLIQYSLNSPSFVYRLELDGPSLDGREDLYLLDGYGVASRLSYLLTKSMPDDELFAAADGDELRTKEQILAQAERIISNSPQFKGAIRDFFSQWLKISDQEMNYSNLFSKNINANASLRQAAEEELHQFVEKTLFEGQGTFAQLMNSRKAYYSHSELAKIYEVVGRGGQAVELPEGRSGLLTRAAFLMTGLDNTRPMHRGASFQRNILCASLQQPPPFPDDPDALIEPEFDFNKTTRERFHEKTNQSRCASCHSMINPPAFAFEQFDALGRYRQSEELIDNGSVVNSLPIDSSVDLQLFDGTQVQAQGASDLIAKVSQESAAPACFVQKWVDYAYARKNNEKDSCGMAEMYDLVNSEDSGVVGMVKAIVGMDSFRVRKVSGEE